MSLPPVPPIRYAMVGGRQHLMCDTFRLEFWRAAPDAPLNIPVLRIRNDFVGCYMPMDAESLRSVAKTMNEVAAHLEKGAADQAVALLDKIQSEFKTGGKS